MTVSASRILSPAALAACLALVACGGKMANLPPPAASQEVFAAPAPAQARPGRVESAEAESVIPSLPSGRGGSPPMPLTAAPAPVPVPAEASSAVPPVEPAGPEVLAELARDPELRRFIAMRKLAMDGLIGSDDAERRRAANLGSLLPFSAPPPAAGLERPLPSEDELLQRIGELVRGDKGTAGARAAERTFLLEGLLPLNPKAKAPPVRTDPEAVKMGRERIDRLASVGLVSAPEREQELAAITRAEAAIASQPLPPPEPPPPPARKKKPAGVIPPLEAPGAGPAGIHLLSMASEALEGIAWEGLKKSHPELVPLQHKVVKTVIPDLGTTYRLLAGPLPPAEAETLCRTLRTKGQSCTVTKY